MDSELLSPRVIPFRRDAAPSDLDRRIAARAPADALHDAARLGAAPAGAAGAWVGDALTIVLLLVAAAMNTWLLVSALGLS